ncbi:MAG: sn-glycerol-1-phosphate dehydrogenase [Clostridia bacterium]|nr:sn-glycerol-1-phosphate dehydrogenase [Clostridia bacterium]
MKSYLGDGLCACGKIHGADIEEVITGAGAIMHLPEILQRWGARKPFLLCDVNTWAAAGARVAELLAQAGYACGKYVFPQKALEPDEHAVGAAVMHDDHSCDVIIGVGSGVINDIGKILSRMTGRKYIIVGTAPSMDGYASGTSSMSLDGLKVSLPSRCADVIIGDTDILKNAPAHMLSAGLGDMLAKYVSIAEWRIAHIVTGEYYCERVAQLIREALDKCVRNAEGLLARDEAAVEAVFEGLVKGGIAMAYAGVSRPASGVEHYFSHVWDMRGLALGTPVDLHGIQCAIGTYEAVKIYERMMRITPDREKAKAYAAAFSFDDWSETLRRFVGAGAEAMIAQEAKEHKYDTARHAARLEIILAHWEEILAILREELPSAARIEALLNTLDIPLTPDDLGVDRVAARTTFMATKDIRDKYVLSRLAWDLGVMEEMCAGM